jgi:glycosyltransferase involved in cell wall biosynthesis
VLSVIIITKNEARDLRACLESVAWADEIIVLDSGSTDDTLAIAREYSQHVYTAADWQGFGVQKNRALAYATGDWVLSLDADERVSDELRAEIEQAMRCDNALVFNMPRLSRYCGRFIHHSGWSPDRVARLFKRGHAHFSNDLVHERLVFAEKATQLTSPLLHYTYHDLHEVIDKINHYSTLGAQNAYNQGKRGSLRKALTHGLWAFLRTYLLRMGFLDGEEGLMLAISNAEATYYRYLKLYEIQKNATH